jgi:hypothetical protein
MTIDVTDLLEDPDFATTFDMFHTTSVVDAQGMNQLTASPVINGVIGVVTPNPKAFVRQPDGSILNANIMVYTKTILTNGEATNEPDVVIWNGHQWLVKIVTDYHEFGQGFVVANCDLQNFNL